jgi:hypothetical protein
MVIEREPLIRHLCALCAFLWLTLFCASLWLKTDNPALEGAGGGLGSIGYTELA